ncbi:glycerate dehydrogenase [Anaerocolumna jejuensis DSM 15929]|uniref:Glycerate dehydrogenase n=1 Tax=Anaerocolumna jejuensis DSM 15929 TaxID=1121322 RepID=A0A1M6MT04_9FIRM|nr:D-2-hydroxyacid dehydrogenase [Anaerocolumna jejuensis]SHJ86665.1 glycerate dehydrogenase [Anaerocolumna jejuensis DSM 15929]
MKIVFLETDSLGDDVDLSIFDSLGEVIKYNKSETDKNSTRIKEADILVVNKIPMKEENLKEAKNLKLICITGTGTNMVDFPYVNGRGIAVANVKGYSTQSVVQHTFALLFYLYEKLSHYDAFVKSGGYVRSDIFSCFDEKFNELYGKTWGIIGLGDIGKGVAGIAGAFGCKVVYYSTSGRNQNKEYTRVDFDTLLKKSDIISIHAPLNKDTENLIGEEALSKMKPSALLLNLGRGQIIDEAALYRALSEGWIAGAGLDVLRQEPMAADNPLLAIQDSKRLIITPHIAWATVEARKRCVEEVLENMKAFLRGEERNIVKQ